MQHVLRRVSPEFERLCDLRRRRRRRRGLLFDSTRDLVRPLLREVLQRRCPRRHPQFQDLRRLGQRGLARLRVVAPKLPLFVREMQAERKHVTPSAGADADADGNDKAYAVAFFSPSPGLPRRAPARPALLLVRSAGRLGQVQRDLDAGVLQGLVRQVPFPFPFPAGDSGADGAVDARSDAAADHAVADDARSNAPTDHAVADDARSDAPVADDARSNTPADHAVADGAPGDDKARANAFSSITTGLPRRPPARSPLLLVRAAGWLGQVRRDLDARILQGLVRQVPFLFPFPAGDAGADGADDARSDAQADNARSDAQADHAVADGAPGDNKARSNAFSSITTGLPRCAPARPPLLLVRAAGRLGQVRRDLDARVLQALVRQVLRRRRRLFAGRRRPGGTWEENREGDSRFFSNSRDTSKNDVRPLFYDLFSPHQERPCQWRAVIPERRRERKLCGS